MSPSSRPRGRAVAVALALAAALTFLAVAFPAPGGPSAARPAGRALPPFSASAASSEGEVRIIPAAPGSTEPSADRSVRIRLIAAGDIMVHEPQLAAARIGPASWDFRPQIAPAAAPLRSADLAVGNLEVPLGGGRGGYTGYPAFSAPDELADALRDAGFDLLFTANNHCLDRGEAGALRTLEVLDSRDIAHTGTFPASADPAPTILSADGITLAFLSYTYGTNGLRVPPGIRVNRIDPKRIASDVRAARATSPDLVVVAFHYGLEYRTVPVPSQTEAVRSALAAGADLILGGHPHVLQRVDVLSPDRPGGTPRVVAWSLGNFLSSQRTVPRDRGALLEIEIRREAGGTARVTRVAAIPLRVRYDRIVGGRRRIEVRPIPGAGGGIASGRSDAAVRAQVLELLTRGARGQTPLRREGDRWILFETPRGAISADSGGARDRTIP